MTKTNLANSFNKGFHGTKQPPQTYSGTSDLAKKNKGKGISGEGAYSKPLKGAKPGQNITT